MTMEIYSTSDEGKSFFTYLYIVTTVAIMVWCLYKYTLNEDKSLVGYLKFNDDRYKRYPPITIFLCNTFYNENLKKYGPGSIPQHTPTSWNAGFGMIRWYQFTTATSLFQ